METVHTSSAHPQDLRNAIQESDLRIPMNPDDQCYESDDDTVQNHFQRRLDSFDQETTNTLHNIFEKETGQYNNEEAYTQWRLANCVTMTCGPSTQLTSIEAINTFISVLQQTMKEKQIEMKNTVVLLCKPAVPQPGVKYLFGMKLVMPSM